MDLVAEAMQKAKQEAEILKAKRRLEKLQAAGHDITHLKAAYEGLFVTVFVTCYCLLECMYVDNSIGSIYCIIIYCKICF